MAGMVKIAFLWLTLVATGLAQGQSKSPAQSSHMRVPVLLPSEAVKLAARYLVQTKKIRKDKLRVSDVQYRYFSTTPAPSGVIEIGWTIGFECVPEKLDCGFIVGVSNSETPKVVMYPVR
ncbi:hypothetical protein RBA41_00640 [Massilia sp. CCM 9210]|uniref:hypothetical protein n=1 Tax=Massilia scottii TaxID=3057166 RepID=UPI002796B56A|nr:hypothetical protein [Massilia sp. CCM 9210]MDQ1811802.1 hypothetical protein [Massilia sp. CCM 9210]